jgi:hypothetical protein
MQNPNDTARTCFGDHRSCIVLGVACMHYHWLPCLTRESKLLGKCPSLLETRGVVIVIVEPALPYRYSSSLEQHAKLVDMTGRIESARVVWMNSRREKNKSTILLGDGSGCASGAEDIPGAASGADADYCRGSVVTCSFDYRAAVAVERRVGEVRVAVDVPREIPIFLGHFLSIQRSVGPAM